ncbi:protein RAS2 [Kluyveromyces marxianus]|uniref:Protein RAS2 n=1 Tax=Kluyveromyces marxianus TaxID=4911 RepID=A0ABX6F1A7_KLUMA|nr:protein RAS2 [Kluyveromyces marxianus]
MSLNKVCYSFILASFML